MKKYALFSYIFIIATFFLFTFTSYSFAQSEYVLPYPSSMPGSIFYKINLVKERLMKYWYFGDFAQFSYNLKQSDKYLVEAKTLFEYKQYLLAYNALKKSDQYFKKTRPSLEKAKLEGKNVIEKENMLKNASLKHIEILTFINSFAPNEFIWTPEKASSTRLNFQGAIEESISIREKDS